MHSHEQKIMEILAPTPKEFMFQMESEWLYLISLIFCPPLPMMQPMRSFGMAISVVVCCCWGWAGRACGIVLVALGYAAAICGKPGMVATKLNFYFSPSFTMGTVFILIYSFNIYHHFWENFVNWYNKKVIK